MLFAPAFECFQYKLGEAWKVHCDNTHWKAQCEVHEKNVDITMRVSWCENKRLMGHQYSPAFIYSCALKILHRKEVAYVVGNRFSTFFILTVLLTLFFSFCNVIIILFYVTGMEEL